MISDLQWWYNVILTEDFWLINGFPVKFHRILNTCLKDLQDRADSCEDSDYDCLCRAYESLAT